MRAARSVPPGPDNRFLTGAEDRQQPTRFLPGHNRYQCVMVMGEDFEGGDGKVMQHEFVTFMEHPEVLQAALESWVN